MNDTVTVLQQLLHKLGVSQAALARHCFVSPATISLLVKHGQWPKRHAFMLLLECCYSSADTRELHAGAVRRKGRGSVSAPSATAVPVCADGS